MFKRYLPLFILVVIAAACSKGKLETRPSIEIKSINGSLFPVSADILITLDYRDKEGDLGNGELTYIRNRLNVYYPVTTDKADTVPYPLPDFPKTANGEIQLRIPARFLDERPDQNDTVSFRIFVKDLAGNVSDTIATPPLVEFAN